MHHKFVKLGNFALCSPNLRESKSQILISLHASERHEFLSSNFIHFNFHSIFKLIHHTSQTPQLRIDKLNSFMS